MALDSVLRRMEDHLHRRDPEAAEEIYGPSCTRHRLVLVPVSDEEEGRFHDLLIALSRVAVQDAEDAAPTQTPTA